MCIVRFARILAIFAAVTLSAPDRTIAADGPPSLRGHLLIASPGLADPRFAQTVVYLIAHDDGGAMGLVVNRTFGDGPLDALLAGFGVAAAGHRDTVRLHYGGPVEPERGFVLHSTDYAGVSTRQVADGVAVSMGRDVLEAVAVGKGPAQRLFMLGHAGWSPGQLEREIAGRAWLTAPADASLLFSGTIDDLWQRALRTAGTTL
jgi:putative transcriptional regulator